jgi:glucoamylase
VTIGGGCAVRIGIAALAVLAAAGVPASAPAPGPAGLFADGLAVTNSAGAVVVVPPRSGESFVPGTRVLTVDKTMAGASADATADRQWLVEGTVPGPTSLLPMNRQALLDLRSLTLRNGAVLAGSTPAWRYVWPRDASFAAAAYSATGHRADALRVLTYLESIAPADGRWQARYLADGSGRTPDERGVQLDGAGWILWATGRYIADAATGAVTEVTTAADLTRLWPMVAASADAIAGSLGKTGLPPASPDYWEKRDRTVTLGTVAPDLAGLRAAVGLAKLSGRTADARRWAAAASTLQVGMDRQFGTDGWHRTRGGDFDTAATFTVAPFLGSSNSGVSGVVPRDDGLLERAFDATRNSNGGVRPGANWHRDGVSWTPETALFALAFASNGEPVQATQLLSWLSAHRTGLGSLPEKVNPDGSPAAVAPLAWTCALVLLASTELDQPRR